MSSNGVRYAVFGFAENTAYTCLEVGIEEKDHHSQYPSSEYLSFGFERTFCFFGNIKKDQKILRIDTMCHNKAFGAIVCTIFALLLK